MPLSTKIQMEERKDQLPLNTLEYNKELTSKDSELNQYNKELTSKDSELNQSKSTPMYLLPKWQSISVNNMPIQSVKNILDVEARKL